MKIKILLLGDATTPHIIKWANALCKENIDVLIFSLQKPNTNSIHSTVKLFHSEKFAAVKKDDTGAFSKVIYLTVVPQIRSLIKKYKPDIVHAHYASSYGLLGALTGFHPYVLSIWGSDIIDFPQTSYLHSLVFKFTLSKAERILSTSHFMAGLVKAYTKKPVEITPFGIDLEVFRPADKLKLFNEDIDCIIGTIKGLEWYYGIEVLIEAFKIVTLKLPQKSLKLVIVGGGALETKIRTQVKEYGLENKVLITGRVDYNEIQNYHNLLDIFVAVSVYEESFGVAVLEASACEKPVIISRAGGMVEVVQEDITGFIVPQKDPEGTADKLIKLINDESLRSNFGRAGRKMVSEKFDLKKCVGKMISVYESLIDL